MNAKLNKIESIHKLFLELKRHLSTNIGMFWQ